MDQLAGDWGREIPPVSFADLRDDADYGQIPAQVRVLVFQRGEHAEARRRWPPDYLPTDDEYLPAEERRSRELADSGVPVIQLVPATVTGLCEYAEQVGADPTDKPVKARYCDTIADEEIPPRARLVLEDVFDGR